jgi:hypothetical protein
MRAHCTYAGDDNAVAGLQLEHLAGDGWEPLDLGPVTPGFEIFVYAIFACQHLYFRVNCAERGLLLDSADGSIEVGADADWNLETLNITFDGRLRAGRASAADIDYITARMQQCPVSRNLREVPDCNVTLTLA